MTHSKVQHTVIPFGTAAMPERVIGVRKWFLWLAVLFLEANA